MGREIRAPHDSQWYITLFVKCLACGYDVSDDKIHMLNEFLDSKKCTKIDLHHLLSVLTHLKELDLINEKETEGDEYRKLFNILAYIVDAFVALGGESNKEGTISKKTLIEIIKHEFELTIDMEVTD